MPAKPDDQLTPSRTPKASSVQSHGLYITTHFDVTMYSLSVCVCLYTQGLGGKQLVSCYKELTKQQQLQS